MSSRDRYVETYTSVPEHITEPYVIPPLEKSRGGFIRSTSRPLPPGAPRKKKPLGAAVFVGIAVAVAFAVGPRVVSAIAEGPWWSDDESITVTPVAVPSAPSPRWDVPEPAAFAEVDQAGMDAVLARPQDHVGEYLLGYAEVLQAMGTASTRTTDDHAILVTLSADQPARDYEFAGAQTALVGDADLLEGVETGDLLRVRLLVTDPEEAISIYASSQSSYTELRVLGTERATFYDLFADVALGEVNMEGELPVLPVSVHNSAARPMEYAIDVVAVLPDGSTAASATAWSDLIAAGETGSADITLHGTLPEGVTFRVEEIDRYKE